ncbi:hypothetical protein C8Q75DRAFT_771245 [Abortiporus biennis]|nr:hypothetical protein C8Q75DRAFT_771245 [Abortiporus biennis]
MSELTYPWAFQRILSVIIPPRESQIPFSLWYLFDAFSYLIPYLFLAYLSRRRDTHVFRLLLLPLVITVTLHDTFKYVGTGTRWSYMTWWRGTEALTIVISSIDLALSPQGRLRDGEDSLQPIGSGEKAPSSPSRNTDNIPFAKSLLTRNKYNSGLFDALDVLFNPRGLGFKFAQGVHVPHNYRPTERKAFLRAIVIFILQDFLMMELCHDFLRLFPGITTTGHSIYYDNLPPIQRYTVATLLHVAFNTFTIYAIELLYDSFALVAVAFLGYSPESWPPLMDLQNFNLFKSSSLHEFWGIRWHQMLRRNFIVAGGIPGYWVFGRYGFILGTFVASGLYHELSMYTLASALDHRVTLFFTLQAVGYFLEELLCKLIGRRISGRWGNLWVITWCLVVGQMASDAWLVRGLGANTVSIPPVFDPVKRHFIPILQRYVRQWLDSYK